MRFSVALAYASLMLLVPSPMSNAQLKPSQSGLLRPFTTDGCSVWLDGTPKQPYLWREA